MSVLGSPEWAGVESWRVVWRVGFAPLFTTEALLALRDALATDDYRLTQGSTTTPPPLMCVQDWPVEAADCIGFVGAVVSGGFCCTADEARGRSGCPPHTNPGAATVGACEEFFARAGFDADRRLGAPAECRWFLNFWDDTPRGALFREMRTEVELELSERDAAATDAPPGAADAGPTSEVQHP